MERRSSLRALVVEDDNAILNLVKIVLERENFIVEGVRNGAAAVELLSTVAYDLFHRSDDAGARRRGAAGIPRGETQPKYLRRVIITTASPNRMSCEFLRRICRLLAKPFDIDELILIAKECAQPEAA